MLKSQISRRSVMAGSAASVFAAGFPALADAAMGSDPAILAIAAYESAAVRFDAIGALGDDGPDYRACLEDFFARAEDAFKSEPATREGALALLRFAADYAFAFDVGRQELNGAILRAVAVLEGGVAGMTKDDITKACPVAALADEALRLIDAYTAVDEAESESKGDREARLEGMKETTHNFLYGVLDRASFLRATSAKGALFQICIISDFTESLEARVQESHMPQVRVMDWEDEKAQRLHKAIERMLHSIAGYIESTGDARLENSCGDYFMSRVLSDHSRVDKSLAMLSAKEAA